MKTIKYISLLGILIFGSLNHSSLFGSSVTINTPKMRQDFIQNAKNGNIKELKKALSSNPAFRNMVYNEKTINEAFKAASLNNKDKAVKILLDTNKVSKSAKEEVAVKRTKNKGEEEALKKANRKLFLYVAKSGNQKRVKELLNAKGIDRDTLNKASSEARLNGRGNIAQIVDNYMRSKGWPI